MATLEDLLIRIGIDSKGAKKGADGLKRDLGKTWDVAKGGAAAAGLAIGAAVMGGIQSMIESSKPVALMQAQLGAAGPLAEDLGKAAGDLYNKGVVDSMETATATIRALWQNGLVDEDAAQADIDRVAGKLSTLATIAEEEAGNVSNAVKQMMRTGLVKNADEAMDLLVRGVQQGVNKAGDLFDTFNEYGTQFRKLGLGGADAMGLMSQAIKGGARDADIAADALKEFSIRAVDGSKLSAEGFKALGMDAEKMTAQIAKGGPDAAAGLGDVLDKLREMKDPVKQNAAAVALFGTQAEDLGTALFDMDLDTAAKGLGDVAGAADAAGQTMEQSAGAKLESFKRKALAGLTEQLAKMIPAIEKTFGWLQRNSSWVTPLAIGLGLLAAAIGVIVAVQWAWNAALAVSPVTWIVLAVVALIAVIVYLATKTQFFQTIWAAVWGFLKKVGAWFAGPFASFFVDTWNAVWGFFKRVGAWFAGPFANFFVMLWNKVKAFAAGAWNAVKAYFGFWQGLFQRVVGWGVSAVTGLVNKWKSFWTAISSIAGKVSSKLRGMWDGMKSGFRSAINWVIGKWNGLRFSIPSFSILGKNFGGGSVGVPRIPMLAEGGLVTGPTLAMIGEGGEDEIVSPVSKLPDLAGDRAPVVIELRSSGNRVDDMLIEILRTAVKDKGGDVQFVIGQKKRG